MIKKWIWLFLLTLCLVVPLGVLLSACGSDEDNSSGKTDIDISMVEYNGTRNYQYTGGEITLEEDKFIIRAAADDKSIDHKYFTFSYEDNVNVGTAKCTITATDKNPQLTGSVVYEFEIFGTSGNVGTLNALETALASGNYATVTIMSDLTIPSETTITIPEGVSLKMNASRSCMLTNNGTIVVDGIFAVGALSGYYHTLVSTGKIINNGRVSFTRNSVMYLNEYEDTDAGTIANSGTIYTNTAIPNLTGSGSMVLRKNLDDANIELVGMTDNSVEFQSGTSRYTTTVKVDGNNWSSSNTFFENNTKPTNNARVTVSAVSTDRKYYGQKTIGFKILKGEQAVTNYDEMVSAQATGNFDRYTVKRDITIPVGQTLTLAPDEILTASGFTINGTLINQGTLNANGTINLNGTLENETTGKLNLKQSASLYGTLINRGAIDGNISSSSMTVYRAGQLTNNGNLTINGMECRNMATLQNQSGGSLVVNAYSYLYGTVDNAGAMQFNGRLKFNDDNNNYTNVNIVNRGTMVINGDSEWYQLDLINTGKITNAGKMTLTSEQQRFENIADGLVNPGKIYAYAGHALANVDDANVVYRKYLTVNQTDYQNEPDKYVLVTLNEASFVYDGNNHIPALTLQDGTSTLTVSAEIKTNTKNTSYNFQSSNSDYVLNYVYNQQYANDNYIVSAGKLNAIVKPGYGNLTCVNLPQDRVDGLKLPYTINRATITVTDVSNLWSLLTNGKNNLHQGNYDRIILAADMTLTTNNYDLEIKKHCTLDLGAYALTLKNGGYDKSLRNSGTVTGAAGSKLLLQNQSATYATELNNNGTIQDVATIYIAAPAKLHNRSTGKIIANVVDSKLYSYQTSASKPDKGFYVYDTENKAIAYDSSANITVPVYERSSLATLVGQELTLDATDFVYDETEHKPAVKFNGVNLTETTLADRFDVTYQDYTKAGTGSVVVALSSELDQEYYGEAKLDFNIARATRYIKTFEELQEGIESRNYNKFVLQNNITLTDSIVLGDVDLAIELDLGLYNILSDGGYNYKITVQANSKICVAVGDYGRFYDYMAVADKITLTDDIKVTTNSTNIGVNMSKSYFNNSRDKSEVDPNKFYVSAHYYFFELDLNGHTLGYNLNFNYEENTANNTLATIKIYNSGHKAVSIGQPDTANYGINISNGNQGTTLNCDIQNVTVYNMLVSYDPTGAININTTDTIFQGNSKNYWGFRLHQANLDSQSGIYSTVTTISHNNLSVTIDNVDNVKNSNRANGIYVGSN